VLGIYFWREGLEAALGSERMGEKGGCCRPPEDAPTSDALTQNLLHHAGRLDTGRGVVETLVFVGEAFVVDPETMQGGGNGFGASAGFVI